MTLAPSRGADSRSRTPGGLRADGGAPDRDVRVGDRERSEAADRLAAHAAAGRLTVEELAQRLERAHAAVFARELAALEADLPMQPGRHEHRGDEAGEGRGGRPRRSRAASASPCIGVDPCASA
jgi:hypothetical protein